jgi:hypothetical protein
LEVFSLIVPALDSSVTADTAAANAEGSDSFQPKKSKPTTLTSLKIEMLVGICTPAAVQQPSTLRMGHKRTYTIQEQHGRIECSLCICMYVCMYVCMCVRMHLCV